MPIKITITPTDVLRSKLVEPNWYTCKVGGVEEKLAKSGDSTNYIVDFVIKNGPAQKDGASPIGVPVRRYFSEKAIGMMIPFFKAFGVTFDGAESKTLTLEAVKDKELDVYVLNELGDDNKMRNKAEDFAPAGTNVK